MAQDVTLTAVDRLPGPMPTAFDKGMVRLPTLWGRLKAGMRRHVSEQSFREAIEEGINLPPTVLDEVVSAGRLATSKEQQQFLRMLVTAWPNASAQTDLAGYGAQLTQDVAERRPSRYALSDAGRQLRQTKRFLPSICEVLEAIDLADKRITAVLRTMHELPQLLDEARRELAARDQAARRSREKTYDVED